MRILGVKVEEDIGGMGGQRGCCGVFLARE
jgi:hypothetical protein